MRGGSSDSVENLPDPADFQSPPDDEDTEPEKGDSSVEGKQEASEEGEVHLPKAVTHKATLSATHQPRLKLKLESKRRRASERAMGKILQKHTKRIPAMELAHACAAICPHRHCNVPSIHLSHVFMLVYRIGGHLF